MQETKTFRPTIGVVTALGVFYGILILGAAYMFVSGAVRHPRGDILAASAGLAAFFLLNGLMIAYLLSCGAVVTATEIMKTSLFGRKSLAISNVRSAIITGGVGLRSLPVLSVRAGPKRINFVAFGLSIAQLHEIQSLLQSRCRAQSVEIETLVPPIPQKDVPKIAMIYILLIIVFFGFLIFQGIQRRQHSQASIATFITRV